MATASPSPTDFPTTKTSEKAATLPAKLEAKKQDSEEPAAANNGESQNNEQSSFSKASTLHSAMQFFSKMVENFTSDKPNEQTEDSGENGSHKIDNDPSKTESSNALRVLGKVAALPSRLADRVKATQSEQLEAGELMNLAFLEDHEKMAIQRVIQADLRLRKTILG